MDTSCHIPHDDDSALVVCFGIQRLTTPQSGELNRSANLTGALKRVDRKRREKSTTTSFWMIPPQDTGYVDGGDWYDIQDDNVPGPSQRSPAHSPPPPKPSKAPLHSNCSQRSPAHSLPPPEPSEAPLRSNRSGCIIRMPRRYADFVPGDDIPEVARADEIMPEEVDQIGNELISFQTEPDAMGLYRVYPTRPTLFPQTPLNTLCNTPMLQPVIYHVGP
ncbi:hypothetical protein DFH29DRAFT_884172 [Suillus ampliporus]|nr:hypothetical protein DFH29DRAFT_884172 [Suillus ampliporus]